MFVPIQWFKSQKVKKPSRVLPPLTPCSSVVNHPNTQSSVAEGLIKLKVALLAKSDEDIVSTFYKTFNTSFSSYNSFLIFLFNLPFYLVLIFFFKGDWKQKVNAAGASFHANVKKGTSMHLMFVLLLFIFIPQVPLIAL